MAVEQQSVDHQWAVVRRAQNKSTMRSRLHIVRPEVFRQIGSQIVLHTKQLVVERMTAWCRQRELLSEWRLLGQTTIHETGEADECILYSQSSVPAAFHRLSVFTS